MNQTVKLPRWRKLASYSRQFVTLNRCVGMWWRQEDEQALAIASDPAPEAFSCFSMSWQPRHPVEIGTILAQRAVAQGVASSSDGDRAQQQALERSGEGVIAAVHRVLCVAQQMRQAELP